MDSKMKSHILALLCKLNIEKAYAHVNWEFFFLISWRGWVLVKSGEVGFILVLPRYNFLSWLMLLPVVFFGTSRGLWQGHYPQ